MRELEQIEAAGLSGLDELPGLLKRVALVAYPRIDVASLTGDAWLGFLDGTLGTTDFSQGPGRVLPELAYASPDVSDKDAAELLKLSASWIRHHRRTTET